MYRPADRDEGIIKCGNVFVEDWNWYDLITNVIA
jgi:hypothetical protein